MQENSGLVNSVWTVEEKAMDFAGNISDRIFRSILERMHCWNAEYSTVDPTIPYHSSFSHLVQSTDIPSFVNFSFCLLCVLSTKIPKRILLISYRRPLLSFNISNKYFYSFLFTICIKLTHLSSLSVIRLSSLEFASPSQYWKKLSFSPVEPLYFYRCF